MKKYLLIILVFICMVIISCDNTKTSTYNSKNKISAMLSLSCDSVLHLIVNSTNIDGSLKNQLVTVDGITNDTMLIKLYHENEAEKDAFVEAADAWIEIELKHDKIFILDIPLDKRQELNCDTALLSFFIGHCASKYKEQ